jgi:hypothetical protein
VEMKAATKCFILTTMSMKFQVKFENYLDKVIIDYKNKTERGAKRNTGRRRVVSNLNSL